MASIREVRRQMLSMYGRNEKITGEYNKSLAAICTNGIFIGEKDGDVVSYKGIPFAKPPVGELRWKRPVPVDDDNGVYQAKYFGPSPIQSELASERASLYVQSEDCLYLNVWLNALNDSKKKPVLVFIHGGSYGWGGTSDPLYEGTNLIRKFDDIILVTIEYRTGLMGFMDFSFVEGGENFPDSGNLGLFDQIEALRWIQKNIEAFGGDPDNVTIAGESAGGGSVSILPIMKESKGLFKKVIAESGSIALSYSKDEVHDLTIKLMENAGAKNMDDLMALDEDRIIELNKPLNDMNNFPLRDGVILPEDLYEAYENGAGSDITILQGTNSEESRYWINEIGNIIAYAASLPIMFENNMRRVSAKDMKLIDKFLESRNEREVWKKSEFYTEMMFRIPAIFQAERHAKNGGKNYLYYWNYPSAYRFMGACHAVELAYVFNNLTETIYTGENINFELADKVQNMWVNFVRNGNPSIDGLKWPEYNEDTRETMILGADTHIETDPLSDQRKLLTPILKYRFNGCYANLDLNVPSGKKLKRRAVSGGLVIVAIIVIVLLILFL